MKNDPLEILIVPHAVVEWKKEKGLLMKKYLPQVVRREMEKGKYAIFHGSIRLGGLFEDFGSALMRIHEIIGDKRKCWENKRIFQIKQL